VVGFGVVAVTHSGFVSIVLACNSFECRLYVDVSLWKSGKM